MKYTTEINIYADDAVSKTIVELFGHLKAADGRIVSSSILGRRAQLTVESNGMPKVEKFRAAIPGSVAEYFAVSEDGKMVSNVPNMVRVTLDATQDEIYASQSLMHISTWAKQMSKDEVAERMADMLDMPVSTGFDRLYSWFQDKYPVRIDEYAYQK